MNNILNDIGLFDKVFLSIFSLFALSFHLVLNLKLLFVDIFLDLLVFGHNLILVIAYRFLGPFGDDKSGLFFSHGVLTLVFVCNLSIFLAPLSFHLPVEGCT